MYVHKNKLISILLLSRSGNPDVTVLFCFSLVVATLMSLNSNSPYKGLDRAFCIRMKSTLTKRGCHFKSSGYRVSSVWMLCFQFKSQTPTATGLKHLYRNWGKRLKYESTMRVVLTVHLTREIMWNGNLMQQGNFINVFLARHVSGTSAHHQEH